MKLIGRLVASVLALLATSTLSTTASADPTLRDLLAETSKSIGEVNQATLRVVQARKAYDEQLDVVRAAAADLLRVFADDSTEAPEPKDNPVIRSLLLPATPKLPALTLGTPTPRLDALRLGLRLPIITPAPKLASLVLKPLPRLAPKPTPKPISRLAALLAPQKPFLALRLADPQGTSIYDSLTFATK